MLDLKVVDSFIDRQAVIKAVDKGKRTAMNRIGGFIRTTAKRSIRKRKGTSAAGQPPHSHTGLLRNHIYYSYDKASDSVVIGPALIKTPNPSARPISGTVPQTLEYGGRVKLNRKSRRREVTRNVEVVIRPRPFMGPAMNKAKEADKLSQAWKDVVK